MGEGIATVLGAVASIASTAVSAYSVFKKSPDVKIPTVQIPQADLDSINAAISANKGLSDQARATINQSIQMYNEGKLTPQYQAKLDEWWNNASKSLSQRLASAGLENSSVAASAYNELQTQYTSMTGDFLRTQLSDALSLTGLAQENINELMAKTQLELGGQAAYAQSYAQALAPTQAAATQKGGALGTLSSSLGGLGDTLKKLGIGTTSTTSPTITGTETTTPWYVSQEI